MESEETTRPHDVVVDSRVALAAERTLLAWIRTSLAMMGFGFVVSRFGLFLKELAVMKGVDPGMPSALRSGTQSLSSLTVGLALVGLGVLVNLFSTWQYISMSRRFRRGMTEISTSPSGLGIAVGIALAILGVVMGVYLLKSFTD